MRGLTWAPLVHALADLLPLREACAARRVCREWHTIFTRLIASRASLGAKSWFGADADVRARARLACIGMVAKGTWALVPSARTLAGTCAAVPLGSMWVAAEGEQRRIAVTGNAHTHGSAAVFPAMFRGNPVACVTLSTRKSYAAYVVTVGSSARVVASFDVAAVHALHGDLSPPSSGAALRRVPAELDSHPDAGPGGVAGESVHAASLLREQMRLPTEFGSSCCARTGCAQLAGAVRRHVDDVVSMTSMWMLRADR